jgi:hypothetical protein
MPRCKGCKGEIKFIRTVRGRSTPVQPRPQRPDGRKLLVFPDGVMALTHLGFTYGYESHIPFCPNRDEFIRKRRRKGRRSHAGGDLLFRQEAESVEA